MKQQKSILRLISGDHELKLQASDGSRLICEATDVFNLISPNFVKLGINKPGAVTPEMLSNVHEIVGEGTFMDIFQELPGNWSQKWLPQDKVIDFCEKYPNWINREGFIVLLIKKDEDKPIDEKKLDDNLIVVIVYVFSDGLNVNVFHLGDGHLWSGGFLHRVISPQFIPLEA
jgi:hypothetical protein